MSIGPDGRGHVFRPDPYLTQHYPGACLGMEHDHREPRAALWHHREEADEFSLQSHQKALQELKPAARSTAKLSLWRFTRKSSRTVLFTRTDLFLTATRVPCRYQYGSISEAPSPSSKRDGTVTAGNASQRSDGASSRCIDERADGKPAGHPAHRALRRLCRSRRPPETMGIGPACHAIPNSSKSYGKQIRRHRSCSRINEAFATQSPLRVARVANPTRTVECERRRGRWGIRWAPQARALTTTLLNALRKRGGKWGIVSMLRRRRHGRSRAVRTGVITNDTAAFPPSYRLPRMITQIRLLEAGLSAAQRYAL